MLPKKLSVSVVTRKGERILLCNVESHVEFMVTVRVSMNLKAIALYLYSDYGINGEYDYSGAMDASRKLFS
jgi:hypothetical protein